MATTKFSVIWETTEGITTSELPGEYSYKIALNVAEGIQQMNPETTKIVAVVETWKLYPKENEKTEKD
nr:MAG TPA: hypothetical protein [Microviridae sp.]